MAEPLDPRDVKHVHIVHRDHYLGGGPWIAIASVVVVAVVILVWVLTQPNPNTVTVVQTPGPTHSVLGKQQVQIYQTVPAPQVTQTVPGPTVRETNYVPGPTVTKTVAPPSPTPIPGAYNAQGTVVGVDAARGRVTIRIDAVPELNLTPSTRTFHVRDGSDLTALQPGDNVSFVIDYQTGGSMSVEQIATTP